MKKKNAENKEESRRHKVNCRKNSYTFIRILIVLSENLLLKPVETGIQHTFSGSDLSLGISSLRIGIDIALFFLCS